MEDRARLDAEYRELCAQLGHHSLNLENTANIIKQIKAKIADLQQQAQKLNEQKVEDSPEA